MEQQNWDKGQIRNTSREWEGKATEEKEVKEVCVAQRSKCLGKTQQ